MTDTATHVLELRGLADLFGGKSKAAIDFAIAVMEREVAHEEFDPMLVVDMLAEYADSIMRGGEEAGGFTSDSILEQARQISAGIGHAVTAQNGVTPEQVELGYQAAVKRGERKSFNGDPRGMVRVILEAASGVKA